MRFGRFYYLDQDIDHSYHRLNPRRSNTKTLLVLIVAKLSKKCLVLINKRLAGTTTTEAHVHPSLGYQMIYQQDAFRQTAAMYD